MSVLHQKLTKSKDLSSSEETNRNPLESASITSPTVDIQDIRREASLLGGKIGLDIPRAQSDLRLPPTFSISDEPLEPNQIENLSTNQEIARLEAPFVVAGQHGKLKFEGDRFGLHQRLVFKSEDLPINFEISNERASLSVDYEQLGRVVLGELGNKKLNEIATKLGVEPKQLTEYFEIEKEHVHVSRTSWGGDSSEIALPIFAAENLRNQTQEIEFKREKSKGLEVSIKPNINFAELTESSIELEVKHQGKTFNFEIDVDVSLEGEVNSKAELSLALDDKSGFGLELDSEESSAWLGLKKNF